MKFNMLLRKVLKLIGIRQPTTRCHISNAMNKKIQIISLLQLSFPIQIPSNTISPLLITLGSDDCVNSQNLATTQIPLMHLFPPLPPPLLEKNNQIFHPSPLIPIIWL